MNLKNNSSLKSLAVTVNLVPSLLSKPGAASKPLNRLAGLLSGGAFLFK